MLNFIVSSCFINSYSLPHLFRQTKIWECQKWEWNPAHFSWRSSSAGAYQVESCSWEKIGEKVVDVVLTVLAYFTDSKRQFTKNAATIAGLIVVRIINEPTAASVAFALEAYALKVMFFMSYLQTSNWHYFFQIDFKEESWVVVYDLGGGKFDVSVLRIKRSVIKVMETAGDNHLGGQYFVDNMMKHCIQ